MKKHLNVVKINTMCNEIENLENLEKKIMVICVIRLTNGVLDEVKSFPFLNLCKPDEEGAVAKAEEYFIDSIKDCDGYDADDEENYLDEAHFADLTTGKEYFLSWAV